MRLFFQPANRICLACERPARPFALVCDYCGEDLPQRRRRLYLRLGVAGAVVIFTAAFATMRGCPTIPAKLTLSGGVLLALGAGISLLPPVLRGVAGATRRERLWQVVPRYIGGLLLTILCTMAAMAANTQKPWSFPDVTLAIASLAILLAAPRTLDLPWHKLIAGILMAAGLLLT